MDAPLNTLLTSLVAGASALLGVALNSSMQLRTQRTNQQFQSALEAEKRKSEIREKEKALALERLAKAHRLLSTIGREFSLTNLTIIWRAEMKDSEYDQRYLAYCEEVDELRVIAGLFETTISEDVEKLYGQMNIFWGNFMNVLRLTSIGEKVDHNTSCFQIAHETASDIGGLVGAIKSRLTELATRHRNDG
jgi:hypothetical protein